MKNNSDDDGDGNENNNENKVLIVTTWNIWGGFGGHLMLIMMTTIKMMIMRTNYDSDNLEYLGWVWRAHSNAVSKTSSRASVWVLVVVFLMMIVMTLIMMIDGDYQVL